MIEIHWDFGFPYFFKLTSEQIWHEALHQGFEQVRLSPDMTLIQLLMHHYRHAFREFKILLDILWSLHRYENRINWHTFAEKLRKIGLVKTTLITLDQIQSLCKESAEKVQAVRVLDQEIQKMRYKKLPASLSRYFRMDLENRNSSHDRKDQMIARFALDRWPQILFSFYKALIPFPQAIKELYEDDRNWTLPMNYLRFMKWRIRDWAGVRQH
jgi:hypothetical protein